MFSCEPKSYHVAHAIVRCAYMLLDFFAIGFGTIYGTKALSNDDATLCTIENSELNKFRVILLLNVILGYVYLAWLLLMGCCCCCLACAISGMSAR